MRRIVVGPHDHGAVAITFALLLVALMGFVGMGVDVASAYAKKQETQNAADAGALAIAQQCASSEVGCDGDDDLAQTLAESNIRAAVGVVTAVTYPPDAEQTVQVVASTDSPNFFLGIFSMEKFTVTETAVASWQTPIAGPSMLPLTISECEFVSQTPADPDAEEPKLGVPISVYIPSPGGKPTDDADPCHWNTDYPPGGFGWLQNTNCEVSVEVGKTVPSDPGLAEPTCVVALLDKAIASGDVLLIPIFGDQDGQGNSAIFTIERFAALKVLGYHIQTGNVTGGVGCPQDPVDPKDYTETCIHGMFIPWSELGDDYETGGPTTEVSVISLID